VSFVRNPVELNGNRHNHQFKFCGKCESEKPPEGGIDMGQKWICGPCWTRRVTRTALKEARRS